MGIVRIYTATSADGFIADRDGGVDWLNGFNPAAYGFDRFIDEVGSVVLGRRTFDFTRAFEDWPYGDKLAFVVTSQTLLNLPTNTVAVRDGLPAAVAAAKRAAAGDVWIVGGAAAMRGALQLGLVDKIELFLLPIFVGDGIGLIGTLSPPVELSLDSIETFADGVVKITYQPRR